MDRGITVRDRSKSQRKAVMTDIGDFRGIEEYRQWLRMSRLFSKYSVARIRRWRLGRLPKVRSMFNGDYFQCLLDDWESAL